MLRSARVAMHACRLVTDHGFDRMRQNEFAFATPTVNFSARTVLAVFSFHMIHVFKEDNANAYPEY